MRIVEQVAANWEKLAVSLGFDSSRISIIGRQVHYEPVEACFKMFEKWLNGEHDLKPPKWYYLIKCLEDASMTDHRFKDLARDLMIIITSDN